MVVAIPGNNHVTYYKVDDCTWTSWTPCNKPCGGGIKTRKILQAAKNGGKECAGSSKDICNERNCTSMHF